MDNRKQIQKTSNLIAKICLVSKIISIILFVLMLLCAVLVFALKDMLNTIPGSIEFHFQSFGTGINSIAESGNTAGALGAAILYFSITLLVLIVLFHCSFKMFSKISKNHSPFLPEITKYMRIVTVIATLVTLKSSVLIGIILGLTLWAILQIFEYGCSLQAESDETL